ncbi:cytochrome P450 [Gigaspora margarita]|uniref:Cytochrome P450 n=1 Tax=Gigaspora margarita TaxID=4874 RepID=A0A8H4AL80_GIGMA|nr:cytochrome P450 [Gigaspora margarita]
MHYYLIAFVAFIGYIVYKNYIYPLYLSPLCKIPGPPVDSFILGHYHSFLSKQIGEVSARLAKQYGGIVRYYGLFNRPYLLISDPKIVQQVLINRAYEYPKHFLNIEAIQDFAGAHSILFVNKDSHKRQRKMMQPSFSFANVKEMYPTFVQAGHNLKDIWVKQIGNKKEERVSITDIIPNITLDVIGIVGFNYEFNSTKTTTELAQAYQTVIMRDRSQFYETFEGFFPFIKKLQTPDNKRYNEAIEVIQNASAKLKVPVDEQLTYNELLGQVMTLLIAGHETTSTVLSWVLYFLAKNPDAQDRLRKEVLDVLADRDHMPTFDEIEHLKYLECVFKETLRIVPPVPSLFRSTSKNEGTPMLISIHAIHHDPSIWGDDAEYFNPSRWLDPVIKSKVTNSNFLAFSAGPKNCLGMKMADLEFKAILSVIIRNFEFKLVEGFNFEMKRFGLSKSTPGIDLLISKVDY